MSEIDIEKDMPVPHEEQRKPLLPRGSSVMMGKDGVGSFLSGVFNLSCTIVGAGIMSLPAAIKVLGVIPGVLLVIISGLLTQYSIDLLLRFSADGMAYSYGQLMEEAFGRIGKVLLQLCVIINNTGIIVIYLIIVADVFSGSTANGMHHPGVLEEWFGVSFFTGRTFVLVTLTFFVLIPTAWLKSMDALKYTSAIAVGLAVLFIVIVIGITFYKVAMGTLEQPALFPKIDDLASFWNLFTAAPVLICAYLCHFNVHTIRNELKDPSQMEGVVKFSLSVCGMVYVLTGLFGFFLFGDSTASDVLSNFDSDLGVPHSAFLNDLVRLSYGAHIILVFPVVFYALRFNFDGLFVNSAIPIESAGIRFASVTLGLIFAILLGAIFVPSIWVVFQFTGATAGALMLFIFPASIALRDRPKIATKRDRILSWGLIVLAVLTDIVAIYSNAVSLL